LINDHITLIHLFTNQKNQGMKVIIIICIILSCVGVFFPWYGGSSEVKPIEFMGNQSMGFSQSISLNGLHYSFYGFLVILLSVSTLVFSFVEQIVKYRILCMGGVLIFSILPFFYTPTGDVSSSVFSFSYGLQWGFYFTLITVVLSILLITTNDFVLQRKTVTTGGKTISQKESTMIENRPSNLKQNQVCPNCNTSFPLESKFCPNCGKPIITESFCSNCGKKLTGTEKFCSGCGQVVSSPVSSKKEIDLSEL